MKKLKIKIIKIQEKIKSNKYYKKYGWLLKYLIIFKIIKWIILIYIIIKKYKGW
jgi:hypothetical protein